MEKAPPKRGLEHATVTLRGHFALLRRVGLRKRYRAAATSDALLAFTARRRTHMDTADRLMNIAIDGDPGEEVEVRRDGDSVDDGADEVIEEKTVTRRVRRR